MRLNNLLCDLFFLLIHMSIKRILIKYLYKNVLFKHVATKPK